MCLCPWGCPHLSVLWGCSVFISAMRIPHVHLCYGFSPCRSLPWGCPTSICTWDCSVSICTIGLPNVHLCHGDASPDLLAATEHKGISPSSACCQHLSTCPGCEHCTPCWRHQGALWLGGAPCVLWGTRAWFGRIAADTTSRQRTLVMGCSLHLRFYFFNCLRKMTCCSAEEQELTRCRNELVSNH